MANENPSPSIDPRQAEVLLASNLAADDLLWVVRCSVDELHRLFRSPVAWVASLTELPGWVDAVSGAPSPKPVLSRDFVLTLGQADQEDPDEWVSVQGISGTNVLRVGASRAAAIRSLETAGEVVDDPFAAFWEDFARDPNNPPTFKKELLVSLLEALSRGFGHVEIVEPSQTGPERARRIANFLLAYVFDPEGLVAMLAGLDQKVLAVRDGKGEPGESVEFRVGERWTATYASVDPEPSTEDDDPPPPASCLFMDGTWVPSSRGLVLIKDGVLKRWGVG